MKKYYRVELFKSQVVTVDAEDETEATTRAIEMTGMDPDDVQCEQVSEEVWEEETWCC